MNTNVSPLESADFKEAIELMSISTTVSNQIEEMETGLQKTYLVSVDGVKAQFAMLQGIKQEADSKLEALSLKHPEWFGDKKSIKTPYGELKFHKSTTLEVKNEDVTIALIEAELRVLTEKIDGAKNESEAAPHLTTHNQLSGFLRQKTELNIEAMENCDDATLKKFRVVRVEKQNFSVKPIKIDLGKAVKTANKQEAAVAA